MRSDQVSNYRALLEGQLAELLGHGEATVHELTRPGDELPDPNDRATRESDTISELRMRDRDRKLIAKVQEALERLDAGTFGLCETCGRPISAARLRARPVTTLCIDCKREAELRERRT